MTDFKQKGFTVIFGSSLLPAIEDPNASRLLSLFGLLEVVGRAGEQVVG